MIQESTVETGQPVYLATADVPPSKPMMCETVINHGYTENRKVCKPDVPICVVYPRNGSRHPTAMLGTAEILRRLDELGIKNADIARALRVTPSRVTEMKKGERALKLDEAVKLVEAFDLEQAPSQRVQPLPAPISRLVVQHIARELGRPLTEDDPALQALAEDLRAFAEFVTDPKVRESIDLATAFFQALHLRRPAPAEAS